MRTVRTLGLLGTGLIGAGWAARALHCGIDVVAYDIAPAREAEIRASLATAAPALAALTAGVALPPRGQFCFTTALAEMSARADFIQENVPETLEIKQAALQQAAAESAPDVVIASSTSGFMPSELQAGLAAPERLVVGHPFNPVYLCPLVEVVAGKASTEASVAAAASFYRSIGMHVLVVRREVPGHLADRLQEAMWREILHALNDDIATTGELDESIVYGPGLRWAIMGMNQIYMTGGGAGGAEHFLRQFAPALELPWTHMQAPELSEAVVQRFVEGTREQAGGKSVRELEMIRDQCLVAIQRVLAEHNVGAGQTLNAFKDQLRQRAEPNRQQEG